MFFKRFVLLFLMVAGAIGVTTLFSPPAQALSYDCTAQTSISVIECEALVAIYEANPEATFDSSWLHPWGSPCDWYGVECYECGEWNPPICVDEGYEKGVVGLHLTGLNLTQLPPEIGNLRNLQSDNDYGFLFQGNLHLSDNNLQVLPSELSQLDKLSRLYLNNNQLKELPDHMPSLWILNLSGNQFEELPMSLISSSPSLGYLGLSNNKLQSLAPEIGQLSSLRSLDISQNQLTMIPEEIGLLQNLSFFYVHDNPLKGPMPEAVLDLPLPGYWNYWIKPTPVLGSFLFFNTNWCIPDEPAYHEWFEERGYSFILGTGLVCGWEPARLTGQVLNTDDAPISRINVHLYRHDVRFIYIYNEPEPYGYDKWTLLNVTETDEHGRYQFENLGQEIDYLLYFESPSPAYQSHYYFHQKQMTKADFINLPLASVTNIDAVLRPYYHAHLPLIVTH